MAKKVSVFINDFSFLLKTFIRLWAVSGKAKLKFTAVHFSYFKSEEDLSWHRSPTEHSLNYLAIKNITKQKITSGNINNYFIQIF